MTYGDAIRELRKFERCHHEKPNGDINFDTYDAISLAIKSLKKISEIEEIIQVCEGCETAFGYREYERSMAYLHITNVIKANK